MREAIEQLKSNIKANLEKCQEMKGKSKSSEYIAGYSEALGHVMDYIEIIEAMYNSK